MKKTTKLLALLLVLAMAAACFTGCSKKSQGTAEAGTIVFGTNPEFPPFEYVTSSEGVIDQYDGIDMAIAKQIADDNGMTAQINNIEFDSLLISLQNGQIDAIIAGMTITDERAEQVDFSTPYYVATQVMIVNEDSDIASAADLAGKNIAVVQGYTGETAVQEMGLQYESFKKGTECVLELTNGKCDAVVIDSATAQKYVSDNEGLKIVEDTDAFPVEEYGIAVKKGNTELLEKINTTVDRMLSDGSIAALSVAYTEAQADGLENVQDAVGAVSDAVDAISDAASAVSDAAEAVTDVAEGAAEAASEAVEAAKEAKDK